MGNSNPWNTNQPFDYSSVWVSSRPIIRSMCRKVCGDEVRGWQQYAMEKYLYPALTKWEQYTDDRVKAAKHLYPRLKRPEEYRCLIVGSNEGVVERQFCGWGFAGEIVASDIADNALARAREQAVAHGYSNIRHLKADLNTDDFSGKFDFIVAEGVLHHIANTERCLEMLHGCLTDDGLLIAAEFFGPFRFQLPPIQVAWINALLGMLPIGLSPMSDNADPRMPIASGGEKVRTYKPPTEQEVMSFDPSEACAGHILEPLLKKVFEVVEYAPAGGTLTTYLQGLIDYNKTSQPPFDEWMDLAVGIEDLLIRQGVIQSDYSFYVLKRRAAPRG